MSPICICTHAYMLSCKGRSKGIWDDSSLSAASLVKAACSTPSKKILLGSPPYVRERKAGEMAGSVYVAALVFMGVEMH